MDATKDKLDAEYERKLLELTGNDVEMNHVKADWLLCELLKDLGCSRTVAAFEKLARWYS